MRRHKSVKQRYSDSLSQLSWQDFERLLGVYYSNQGYRVEHVGTGGSGTQFDGGIDLKLYRDSQYIIVQCKHWNAWQVTHNYVHELLGVMLTTAATSAIVVTSGEFTRAARAAAAKEPRIQLVGGTELRQMLGTLIDEFEPDQSKKRPVGRSDSEPWQRETVAPILQSAQRLRAKRTQAIALGVTFAVIVCVAMIYFAWLAFANAIRTVATPPATVVHTVAPSQPVFPIRVTPNANQLPKKRYDHTTMTEAQLREWKRRNEESMKILEKTTPELH